MRDGWLGIGIATVGIHPNDFDLYPNKIQTGVVQNCPAVLHASVLLFVIDALKLNIQSSPEKNAF